MSFENPYQAPRTETPFASELSDDGLWQHGNLLIMRKDAILPDRCVKTNQVTTGRLKRRLVWHHPAVYLAILANLLIYIILALCLQKKATIHIGLSDEWFATRRRAILIGWSVVLLSMGLAYFGLANVERGAAYGWLVVTAFPLLIGGAIYGAAASRMVVATRIDAHYVYLKGACREFLATLPPWPHG